MSSGPFRGGGGYRLATLPRRFAGHLTADGTLAVTGAPEEIGTLSFSWLGTPAWTDPAQRWLRDTIRAAAPTA